MAGVHRNKKVHKEEQFQDLGNMKLRMSLVLMADRLSEAVRDHIFATYNNPVLHSSYNQIRNSGIYQKGGKSKVHRKILEFPDAYVFDFVDITMRALYGPEWLKNRRALNHELVRPWWVVSKL